MARPVDAEALEKKISEWLGQPGNGDYYSGYDAALCAVQDLIADTPTITPPNEPLTLEQLRQMDGEPVWFDTIKRWGIVKVNREGIFVVTKSGEYEFGRCKVYRCPPEGEEEEKHVIEITENL